MVVVVVSALAVSGTVELVVVVVGGHGGVVVVVVDVDVSVDGGVVSVVGGTVGGGGGSAMTIVGDGVDAVVDPSGDVKPVVAPPSAVVGVADPYRGCDRVVPFGAVVVDDPGAIAPPLPPVGDSDGCGPPLARALLPG